MTRNGCRLRKAEANREIILSCHRIAEIERQLQHVKKDHAYRVSHKESGRFEIRADAKPNLATKSHAESIQAKAPNLRAGCAWKIAPCLSQRSTFWKSFPDEACTFEPGKRAG